VIAVAIALSEALVSKIVWRSGLKIVNRGAVVNVFFSSAKASRAFVIMANAVSNFFVRSVSGIAIRE